jgi:hypothetical protein
MEPWNARIGSEDGEVFEKPLQKCTKAGAERVPPAPCVKINVSLYELVWSLDVLEELDGVYV